MIYQPVTISAGDLKSDGFTVYGANGIIGKYDKFNHETWQTIVTCRGSTCGTVNRTEENSWITGNAMVMNVDENKSIDKLFFYYLLKAQDFSLCITGSGQPQIVRGPLFGFVVNLPPNLEEQIAISTILSDMDSDITALEKQLDKTSAIKQGMMQELLSGRIRLV
jgi:type I restriction enzyme S subunit